MCPYFCINKTNEKGFKKNKIMKTKMKISGAGLIMMLVLSGMISMKGQSMPDDSYLNDTSYIMYQMRYAAERRIADSLAWVAQQNELAKKQAYENAIQEQIAAACAEYGKERELADMMEYGRKLLAEQIKAYQDSIINAEIMAACSTYAAQREFEDAHRYSIIKHQEEAIEAQIAAACAEYAKERELYDMIAYGRKLLEEQMKAYQDSIVNAEIMAACAEYAKERELADIMEYGRKIRAEQIKAYQDSIINAEIMAACAAVAKEMEQYYYMQWIAENYDNHYNNEMKGKTADLTVTATETSSINIKVYPNPASEYINVETEGNGDEVSLIDMSGRIISKAVDNGQGKITFDISSLPEGYYLVRYTDASGKNVTKKFVKQ